MGRLSVIHSWCTALAAVLVAARSVLLLVWGEYRYYGSWILLLFVTATLMISVLAGFGHLRTFTATSLSLFRGEVFRGLMLLLASSLYFPREFDGFCTTPAELAECVTGCLDIGALATSVFLIAAGLAARC